MSLVTVLISTSTPTQVWSDILVCVGVCVFYEKLMDVCCHLRRWRMQSGPLRQHVSRAWKKKSRHAWKLYHPRHPPPLFPLRISSPKAHDAGMTERIRILQRLGKSKALFSTAAEIQFIKDIWLVSSWLANSWKDTHSLCGRVANQLSLDGIDIALFHILLSQSPLYFSISLWLDTIMTWREQYEAARN